MTTYKHSVDEPSQQEDKVYSVGSLITQLRSLLEEKYSNIWVEGEISNLAKPASGHLYFSLKEGNAVIRCAFFRQHHRQSMMPEYGKQVRLKGHISVYANRGDLQLIVHYLEPAGEGALRRQFEMLKQKLQAEGLFDPTHKKPLPAYPKTIGVITSQSGAALRDILVTLKRRYPVAPVIVYPVTVQGESAAADMVEMLAKASHSRETSVLILARGGGSLEDLQSFNDEQVARAIHRCSLPVVSGIGHETDFTIADLVADHRAATPTAAAEAVTPLASAIQKQVATLRDLLIARIKRHLNDLNQRVDNASSRLIHPSERLRRNRLELEALHRRTLNHMLITLTGLNQVVMQRRNIILQHNPGHWLRLLRERHQNLIVRLAQAQSRHLADRSNTLNTLVKALHLLGPERILTRGYAILRNREQRVINSVALAHPGEELTALVTDGTLSVTVQGD